MINSQIQYQVPLELPLVHERLAKIIKDVSVVPGASAVMFVAPPTHYRFMVEPAASVLNLGTLMIDFHNEEQPSADEYAFSLQAKNGRDVVLHGRGSLHLEQTGSEETQLSLAFTGVLEQNYIHLAPDFVSTQLRAVARQLFENLFHPQEHTEPIEQPNQLNRVGVIMLGILLVYLFMRWINKKKK